MAQPRHGRHASQPPAQAGRPPAQRRPPAQGGRARQRTGRKLLGAAVTLGLVAGLLAAAFQLQGSGKPARSALAANAATLPLLGSSVLDSADLAKDTSQFGHMPIVRVYYPGLPPANAWTTGLAGANKSAVIVSFKALPTDILSGVDDVALQHFFDTAPTGHPIYFSYYHEAEDNIEAGQFKLADYKAAWAHVVSLADAAHNSYLHSTLILMEWDLVKASGRDWKSYLPGGGIISVLGWDAYPVGSATNVHPQLTAPADFMGPAIAAARSVGLPYGFAEFGLSTATGRPDWLTNVGKYLMSSGALFGSLFDGNAQYPTLQLTDSDSVSVWHGYVQDSAAGLNPPVNPPAQPSTSPSSSPPPSDISGLGLSPATLTPSSQNHTTIGFTLGQAANVTICILDSHGAVMRTIGKPGQAAGTVGVAYYGFNGSGQTLPAGDYTVLVVTSNAQGSSTAETTLTINAS